MNKKILLVILGIILVVMLIVFKNNISVSFDNNANFGQVHQTQYKSTSSCTSVNNAATIHCDCDIVVNGTNHKISNTINAISCNDTNDPCNDLCGKFADELAKK